MLSPKRVKWRKSQKGRMRGKAQRGSDIAFGKSALVAMDPHRITARQIQAARIAMNRDLRGQGKIRIRILTRKPITRKPAQTPLAKGKAPVEHRVAVVRPGRLLSELAGVRE